MKLHANIVSSMSNFRLVCLCLFYTVSCALSAQEMPDSVRLHREGGMTEAEIEELTRPMGTNLNALRPISADQIDYERMLEGPALQVAPLRYELRPKGSTLPRWATGYLYGNHMTTGNLWTGYQSIAMMGLHQQLGRYWSVDAGVALSKYSVYYNTATFDASITWQPNRYIGVTAFGSYSPGSFLSPMKIAPWAEWGGYITLQTDTDVPFGIDLGARDYYSPLSGHQVTPVVTPFVKVAGAKIGIDVGPVIQDALRRSKGSSNDNGFNPIPKPQKIIPPVGPRR